MQNLDDMQQDLVDRDTLASLNLDVPAYAEKIPLVCYYSNSSHKVSEYFYF